MRQSLMMGVRPRFSANHEFPKIPLGKGMWRLEPENRKDTRVAAIIYQETDGPEGGKFEVPQTHELPFDEFVIVAGPARVMLYIIEPGSEAYINVVAVRHA